MSEYQFNTPFPPGHFVADYIAYAAQRTDAAHEYHEAAALALLALATPGIRARLAPYPHGLPTNLYLLLIGDSTRSRKSTAISLATDIADAAIPRARVADAFSPEAFVEQLASRPRDSTLWAPDEFGELLIKLRNAKYMAGLSGLLLTIYSGASYEVRRHSKRVKGGGTEQDFDRVEEPHLSILGATTPTIFEGLTESDVTNGLLPRFAIVMPEAKPARKPFFDLPANIDQHRNHLVSRLRGIYQAVLSGRPYPIEFEDGTLEVLDCYAETLEESETSNETVRTMQQRLVAMTVKVALLSAVGWANRPLTPEQPLRVTHHDANNAVLVVQRWERDAVRFAERVGESRFEVVLQKCLRLVSERKVVARSVIAQNAHIPKRLLDDIESTLLDRQAIEVLELPSNSGPARVMWAVPSEAPKLAVIRGQTS